MKHGMRWGTYHAFLELILGRPNLKVYRYAWVNKIDLDKNKVAKGVWYTRHGRKVYVAARKEVILSAGAIDSPKLLMLSGIGPERHLSQLGIRTVVNIGSVGENLQDHIGVFLPTFTLNTNSQKVNYNTSANILKFIKRAVGPYQWITYYSPFATDLAMGYISSKANKDKSYPDIQVFVIQDGPTICFDVVLSRTEQTGTVRLTNSKPEEDPLIDPQIFANPQDLERLIDGVEEMADFFLNSPTYKALGIKWTENQEGNPPECKDLKFASRDYWRCYLPIKGHLNWHPTSTCRMGPPRSNSAVVDSRLRVFGTTGLRVVDSSVMPFVPSGNTNFPSIMIGEMGAKIILNQI